MATQPQAKEGLRQQPEDRMEGRGGRKLNLYYKTSRFEVAGWWMGWHDAVG